MRLLALLTAVLIGTVALCAPPQASHADYDPLYGLRQCESGNDYSINTGNGYYGGYQFSLRTWRAVGGEGYPHLASPEEQDMRAWHLLTHYGSQHWPVCRYRLEAGLI